MKNSDWQTQRSAFNHGWLKNRLIACLLRCRRVVSGLVEDDSARDDLLELISSWGTIRPTAEQVLAEMKFRLQESVVPSDLDTSALGETIGRYLLEVDRLRWLELDASVLEQEASEALQKFDAEVKSIRAKLEVTDAIPESKYLQRLEERARSLGKAFSSVSLCEDTIFSANEHH